MRKALSVLAVVLFVLGVFFGPTVSKVFALTYCEQRNIDYTNEQNTYNYYQFDCWRGNIDSCDQADESIRRLGVIGNDLERYCSY